MAGHDPAIHGVPWPPASTRNLHSQGTRNPVDARVKPGHGESKWDAENGILVGNLNLMPMGACPAMTVCRTAILQGYSKTAAGRLAWI